MPRHYRVGIILVRRHSKRSPTLGRHILLGHYAVTAAVSELWASSVFRELRLEDFESERLCVEVLARTYLDKTLLSSSRRWNYSKTGVGAMLELSFNGLNFNCTLY